MYREINMNTITAEKSELSQLLEKNSHWGQELSEQEKIRAAELIAQPIFSENICSICKMHDPKDAKKSIFDTSLCQGHAMHVIAIGR